MVSRRCVPQGAATCVIAFNLQWRQPVATLIITQWPVATLIITQWPSVRSQGSSQGL